MGKNPKRDSHAGRRRGAAEAGAEGVAAVPDGSTKGQAASGPGKDDLRVVGIQPVRESLRAKPEQVQKLFLLEGRDDPKAKVLVALAREHAIPIHRASRASLDKMAGGAPHQGALALVVGAAIRFHELEGFFDSGKGLQPEPRLDLVLALDQVEDPRNFGALARVADGAGVQAILVPHRRSAPVSSAAVSASAGAMLHTPLVRVRNLSDALSLLKKRGFWVVGLAPEGQEEWHQPDYREPTVLVVGSEAGGLRRRVRESCDRLVRLPQLGKCASLNVSVAAGIVLYEAVRQRAVNGQRSTVDGKNGNTGDG